MKAAASRHLRFGPFLAQSWLALTSARTQNTVVADAMPSNLYCTAASSLRRSAGAGGRAPPTPGPVDFVGLTAA